MVLKNFKLVEDIMITETELNNTEGKIIRATFKLLQQVGFTKTTTKKIAGEAGVNEVTIFRKFENKNNLIEVTKKYYFELLINTLSDIFNFDEGIEFEEYMQKCFMGMLNLSDDDFSIIKVAMEEVRGTDERTCLLKPIIDTMLNKSEKFFKFQIKNGNIRDVDPQVLGAMFFSMMFQSVVLFKVYNLTRNIETQKNTEMFLDILYYGIKER